MNRELCFFWVSSLAYPNSLGTKGYVVVVVVVVVVYKTIFVTANAYISDGSKQIHV